ncbi:MAG: hypothetical protein R3320_00050 [Nitriliruptorales bacterium]|nr:hypothetical protein [Nitriliruptorales bacterium]
MGIHSRSSLAAIAIVALAATSCASTTDDAADTTAVVEPAAASEEDRPLEITGELALTPSSGPAGTEVSVSGDGLPAATDFDVVWVGAECDWVIKGEQNEEYHGRECELVEQPVAQVTSDDAGSLETAFSVPDGFGFAHDVLLIDQQGTVRNKAGFAVEMQVKVTPESGPVGTPITIEVQGMGWQSLEDTRTILYDNRYAGFMSAVTTRGTARAVIPATGAPGPHRIEINRGAYTFPYLNPEQSPRPDIPTFEAVFTVTEGDPVLPAPIEEQNPTAIMRNGTDLSGDGPAIATDLEAGPVGTPFVVEGAGFEAGADVELRWFRIVGNRVAGQGWEERAITIGEISAGADGTFEFPTEIPGDVGGPHRIEAVVSDSTAAETWVSVTPHADPLESNRVAWGTDLALHLTGVGWTETANIYTIVYDNTYVGYACGFNTQGDVLVHLKATGEPGWHFIELYPAIYKGEETRGRNNFRIPQLTAADDHPGEDLPIFRYAIYIEGGSS